MPPWHRSKPKVKQMSARITFKTLRAMVDQLNEATGNPVNVWRRVGDRNVAHIGAYVLDANIGGYQLCRITNESGGETVITPRALAARCADLIRAYRAGLACRK